MSFESVMLSKHLILCCPNSSKILFQFLASRLSYFYSLSTWEAPACAVLSIFDTIHYPNLGGIICYFIFFLTFFLCEPFFKYLFNLLQYHFCFMFWFLGGKVCGIFVPWPGIGPALKGEVLPTEPPGKSVILVLICFSQTISLTSAAGKTGQPLVKERN